MLNSLSMRLTAALNVLVTFALAALPANVLAQCSCTPGGCGSARNSGCCSAAEQPLTKSCCAAPEPSVAKQSCCCTDFTATSCSHLQNQSGGQSCECSPGWPGQSPADPSSPTFGPKSVPTSELPFWATTILTIDLSASSSRTTDLALHAPPIPLRELYCVWRI